MSRLQPPQGRPRRLGSDRGLTFIELMIAIFITLVVTFGAGFIYQASRNAWSQGQGKVTLQQNATFAVEQIMRDVRAARALQVVGGGELRAFDASGTESRRYNTGTVSGITKVLQSGTSLVPEECTTLTFAPNGDTTAVTIVLELMDASENRVRLEAVAAVRNRNFTAL